MKPKKLQFFLTIDEAQTIFNAYSNLLDERQLVREIWRTETRRRKLRRHLRKFTVQLNRHYEAAEALHKMPEKKASSRLR